MKDILLTLNEDLYLDPSTGDIQFTDSVAQAIKIRLRWFLSEWKINRSYGFPWYDEVFVKRPSLTLVESRVRNEIKEVEGVKTVDSVKTRANYSKRKLYIEFVVTTEEGYSDSGEVMIYG